MIDFLSEDSILAKVDEETIYQFYLGNRFCVGKSMNAPYRADNNPSFSLFYANDERLIWKDHSTGETGGVIKFVQKLFNLNHSETLKKIQNDIIYSNFSNNSFGVSGSIRTYQNYSKNKAKIPIQFTFEEKKFTKIDFDYWGSFGITESTLNFYNVKVAAAIYYEGNVWKRYSNFNPIYCYEEGGEYKFYRPMELHGRKWSGNMRSDKILGLSKIPDNYNQLIIQIKGYKDVMLLKELGYWGYTLSSESVKLTKSHLDQVNKKSSSLFAIYDNDQTGLNQLKYLKETFNIPGGTIEEKIGDRRLDLSDYYLNFGKDKTLEKLNQLIEKYASFFTYR